MSEPSVNSGLVYKPTDEDTFRLLASRGIQAPSLADFGVHLSNTLAGVPITFAGSPRLKAASVENVEIDYDRVVAPINALLRTAVYYQETDDLLTSAVNAPLLLGPGGLSGYSPNVGSSSAAGGEISLKGASESGMRWKVSYALISIADRLLLAPLRGHSSVLDYRHGAPASVVELGAGYSWDRIEIDGQARWQSRFTDYFPSVTGVIVPFQVNNYVTINARIGYRVTEGLTLAVAGGQLGQAQIFQAAGVPVERRVTVSLTDRY